MITKEQLKEAWENWTSIAVEVHEFCDMCNNGNYGDILIVKMPECFTFCIDCSEKFKDENTYTGIDWWRGVYQIWKWFLDREEF